MTNHTTLLNNGLPKEPVKSVTRNKMALIDRLCRKAVIRAIVGLPEAVALIETFGTTPGAEALPEKQKPIRVHDPRFYRMAALRGALGAADAYRCGYWDADDLTGLFRIFVRRIGTESAGERRLAWLLSVPAYFGHLLRGNGRAGASRNIRAHYDLGNDFFELFLDPTLTYSCGIFQSEETSMQQASEAKLRRICDKLHLRTGMHIAEIGSGWGSFAILAAREYGCTVTTLTLSPSQQREAERRVRVAGLDDLVTVKLMDYRDLSGKFDRVVAIEMIEAIGHNRLGEFFSKCAALLRPDGALAVQVITMPDRGYKAYLRRTDVIREFIFPGSCCPARSAVLEAATSSSALRLTNLEEIGRHYATTLRHWREAFTLKLAEVKALGYEDSFLRLWNFYLCYCEAGFAERHVGTVQMVYAMPDFEQRDAVLLNTNVTGDSA